MVTLYDVTIIKTILEEGMQEADNNTNEAILHFCCYPSPLQSISTIPILHYAPPPLTFILHLYHNPTPLSSSSTIHHLHNNGDQLSTISTITELHYPPSIIQFHSPPSPLSSISAISSFLLYSSSTILQLHYPPSTLWRITEIKDSGYGG